MTLAVKYRFALGWFTVLALLSALDFGLATAYPAHFFADFPFNVLTSAELVLNVAVLLGLKNRSTWGWILAVVWIPVWISYNSLDLFSQGALIPSLIWLPFFFFSAMAHRLLLRDTIREGFDLRGWPWDALQWLPYYTFGLCAFIPLSLAIGTQLAAALCLCGMITIKTAPLVYGGRH